MQALALAMAAAAASANPRAPVAAPEQPKPETAMESQGRAHTLEDVDAWLKNLVGRYRVEAITTFLNSPGSPQGYSGMADCIGVGSGAGVQCVIALNGFPRLYLFGRNPDDLNVHVMEVDRKGVGEQRSGPLRGSSMQSRGKVPNTPAGALIEEVKRYYASPDGRDVRFTIERLVNYTAVTLHTMHFTRISQPGLRPR